MKHKTRRPRIIFYPYKLGSESVRLLTEELRARGRKVLRVRKDWKHEPRLTDFIVNWGCSADNNMWPEWEVLPMLGTLPLLISKGLNNYNTVGTARNKLSTFNALKEAGVSVPEYTIDKTDGFLALFDKGHVIGRQSLTGSQGRDILIFDADKRQELDPENLDEAINACVLFTGYIKKKAEYRIHVFNEQVIFCQQKKKKAGWEGERDTRIRNLANGYVFCHENIVVPETVKEQGRLAVKALGLDFGAADVIWNDKQQKAYVLEVNTAPGLEGSTVKVYADNIEKEFVRRFYQ